MRIDAFQPADQFKNMMDKWIETFKSSSPAHGHDHIIIPGEPERESEKRLLKEGISLVPAIRDDLLAIAGELEIRFE
jgi:LDH2 family malate/lactate/ureidoglycolate dehydrogenase